MATSTVRPSLRALGKLDRGKRIERAARDVFREHGFDGATTREIAARAGVGNATLFLYARDKAQLLAWVFRDEIAAIDELAHLPLIVGESVVDRLERFFRPRYELWARDPRLARAALRLTMRAQFEGAHGEADAHLATVWPRLLDSIATIVTMYQQSGAMDRSIDTRCAARLAFDIYTGEVYDWLARPALVVDDGLFQLRTILAMAFHPMQKQPA